jgi:hypothetical protein
MLVLLQRGPFGSGWFQLVLAALAPYTVWIVISVWRCAFNVEKPLYGHIARALTVSWAINAVLVLGFPGASVSAGKWSMTATVARNRHARRYGPDFTRRSRLREVIVRSSTIKTLM